MSPVEHLRLEGVAKSFGHAPVLADIDLRLTDGEILAVVGPSGSGKTTLGRIVAGFERTDHGRVVLDGHAVDDATTWIPPERRRVGIVPQDGALFPHLDVADNVGAGLPRGPARSRRIDECLELVGLSQRRHARPAELSGGQQQRVALARAIAPSPSLIVLDEPFSALDAALRHQLRADVVRVLRDSGATALLITHDQDEALSMADRVGVLLGGRLAQVATPRVAYSRPASLEVARFLGRVVELEAHWTDGGLHTALGVLPVVGTPEVGSEVAAVLRPEQLRLGTVGTPATVDQVAYLGHDALVTLRLTDGTMLTARTATAGGEDHTATIPRPGERTVVSVVGAALALPVPAPAPPSGESGAPGTPGSTAPTGQRRMASWRDRARSRPWRSKSRPSSTRNPPDA